MAFASRAVAATRAFSTSVLRRSGHATSSAPPAPGDNLPFSLTNRYKLTLYFVLFFGSGLTAPFFVLRHQLLKK